MLNKVQLIGRLGRDPEVRYTTEGKCVANLAIATSESHKDKATGETRQETEWHRVALFGPTGDVAARYLKKGKLVFIEGRIRTRKWQDKSGQDRYTTEIVGHEMLCFPATGNPTRETPPQAQQYTPPIQSGTVPNPTPKAAAATVRPRLARVLTSKTTTSLSFRPLG